MPPITTTHDARRRVIPVAKSFTAMAAGRALVVSAIPGLAAKEAVAGEVQRLSQLAL